MIHLVGLPHTSLDEIQYSTCAFTTKAARWTRVLQSIGRDVTCYWGGGTTTIDEPIVELLTDGERRGFFGDDVGQVLPTLSWDPASPYWTIFLDRAISEIRRRIEPGDMVAVWAGRAHQRIADAFPDRTVIEPAVGYEGLATGTFACFESYAWMHHRYGALGINDGRAFDAVIPNFIDPDDFTIGADDGYALYLGRIEARKGVQVAVDAAARAGVELVVAGAGDPPSGCTYVGVADPQERKRLLSHASCLIVPTQYIEPFGTVHAEALMSGIPVVTTDWGVFSETVEQGVDGFRFRTLHQAAEAIKDAPLLRGPHLRKRAIDRFSLTAVAPRFDEWLTRLETLRDGSGGWYANTGRRL